MRRTAIGVAAILVACTLGLPDTNEYTGGPRDAGASAPPGSSDANANGATEASTAADGGKQTPAGDDDDVVDAGPTDDGVPTCGGNGIDGDHGTLFRAAAGKAPVVIEVCAMGCEWTPRPSGIDRCRSKVKCCCGNGGYCGDDGVSGDPTVLFQCDHDRIDAVRRCENGCVRESSGVSDHCK